MKHDRRQESVRLRDNNYTVVDDTGITITWYTPEGSVMLIVDKDEGICISKGSRFIDGDEFHYENAPLDEALDILQSEVPWEGYEYTEKLEEPKQGIWSKMAGMVKRTLK